MSEDVEDIDEDDIIDNFYNEIVMRRAIARRTNWRYRFTLLSQLEVALAANITSSAYSYINVLAAIIVTTDQLLQAICINQRHNGNSSQLSRLYIQYNFLMMFCFFQLDSLMEQEDQMMNIRHWQLPPLVETAPKNRSIDALSDEDAKNWTRFNKEQLRMLLLLWRIPEVIHYYPP
jgi:hypothetical protein